VRLVVAGQGLDDLAACGDLLLGFGRQFHHGVSPRDRDDVGKAQRAGAHDNGVHVFYVTRQARLALGAPTSSCLVSKTV